MIALPALPSAPLGSIQVPLVRVRLGAVVHHQRFCGQRWTHRDESTPEDHDSGRVGEPRDALHQTEDADEDLTSSPIALSSATDRHHADDNEGAESCRVSNGGSGRRHIRVRLGRAD